MAQVYDDWMHHNRPPYDDWVSFIANEAYLLDQRPSPGAVALDIGCGTGNMSTRLAKYGWNVVGVDPSADMIEAALRKDIPGNCEFRVGGFPTLEGVEPATISLAIACFDTMNYLKSAAELTQSLKQVSAVLRPGGVFVFDFNTRFRLESVFANHHWGEDFDNFGYVWRNRYDALNQQCAIDITFYIRQCDGRYERTTEHHFQRWFSDAEILSAANAANLKVCRVANAYTFSSPSPESLRASWTVTKPDISRR